MLAGKRKLSRHFGRAIFIALHRCFSTSSLHLRLRKALARFPNFATLKHRPLSEKTVRAEKNRQCQELFKLGVLRGKKDNGCARV
ncbi:MAG: hypothetical protein YYHSYBAR_000717 [Candidatus Fervidibacter sacchari]|jgi:hypothetical protein